MKFSINNICGVMAFAKGYFLKLCFEVFGFCLLMFDPFDLKADMHIVSVKQRVSEWYFKMSRLELCCSLLEISIAQFNFILTVDNCLVHCKCSCKILLGT